jgi:large subunit ribosomal protein L6
MTTFSKRYIIKIPKDISTLYCDKKKLLTLIGPLGKKSLQVKLKVLLLKPENFLVITQIPFNQISSNEKKKLRSLQGTTIALIKQMILEVSFTFSKKLVFVGVGYKAFPIELFKNQLLQFKLGYSHQIYFKVLHNLNVYSHKATTIFISGNSNQNVSQTAALVRSYKKPEPYKGKGILYDNEKIVLKEGKKV